MVGLVLGLGLGLVLRLVLVVYQIKKDTKDPYNPLLPLYKYVPINPKNIGRINAYITEGTRLVLGPDGKQPLYILRKPYTDPTTLSTAPKPNETDVKNNMSSILRQLHDTEQANSALKKIYRSALTRNNTLRESTRNDTLRESLKKFILQKYQDITDGTIQIPPDIQKEISQLRIQAMIHKKPDLDIQADTLESKTFENIRNSIMVSAIKTHLQKTNPGLFTENVKELPLSYRQHLTENQDESIKKDLNEVMYYLPRQGYIYRNKKDGGIREKVYQYLFKDQNKLFETPNTEASNELKEYVLDNIKQYDYEPRHQKELIDRLTQNFILLYSKNQSPKQIESRKNDFYSLLDKKIIANPQIAQITKEEREKLYNDVEKAKANYLEKTKNKTVSEHITNSLINFEVNKKLGTLKRNDIILHETINIIKGPEYELYKYQSKGFNEYIKSLKDKMNTFIVDILNRPGITEDDKLILNDILDTKSVNYKTAIKLLYRAASATNKIAKEEQEAIEEKKKTKRMYPNIVFDKPKDIFFTDPLRKDTQDFDIIKVAYELLTGELKYAHIQKIL